MENTYKTKDRFQMYVLLAKNCVVERYESEGKTTYFVFEDKERCEKILAQLLSKKLEVYAHEMIDAIRTVHSLFNR